MEVRRLIAVEPASVSELEKVLDVLPLPTRASMKLHGWDYSSLDEQIGKVAAVELTDHVLDVCVKNPKKDDLIKLYKFSQGASTDTKLGGIYLESVEWSTDDGTRVLFDLQANKINLHCDFKEPKYVSRLREVVAGTKIGFEIEYVKKYEDDSIFEPVSQGLPQPPPPPN